MKTCCSVILSCVVLLQSFCQLIANERDIHSDVGLKIREGAKSTEYVVVLGEGSEPRPIWSHVVPKIDGKQTYEWVRLLAADHAGANLVAVLENNEFNLTILHSADSGVTVQSLRMMDSGWLRDLRAGGILSAQAPDKVVLRASGGTERSFSIRNGHLFDDAGNDLSAESTLEIGNAVPQKQLKLNAVPEAGAGPDQQPRADTSASPASASSPSNTKGVEKNQAEGSVVKPSLFSVQVQSGWPWLVAIAVLLTFSGAFLKRRC